MPLQRVSSLRVMDYTAYIITAVLAGICLLVPPWKRLFTNSYRLPPGPKPEPIIQNLRNFPKREWYKTFTNWQQEYGDLVYANVLGTPFIVINSLDIAKELLEKRGNIYSGRFESHFLTLVSVKLEQSCSQLLTPQWLLEWAVIGTSLIYNLGHFTQNVELYSAKPLASKR